MKSPVADWAQSTNWQITCSIDIVPPDCYVLSVPFCLPDLFHEHCATRPLYSVRSFLLVWPVPSTLCHQTVVFCPFLSACLTCSIHIVPSDCCVLSVPFCLPDLFHRHCAKRPLCFVCTFCLPDLLHRHCASRPLCFVCSFCLPDLFHRHCATRPLCFVCSFWLFDLFHPRCATRPLYFVCSFQPAWLVPSTLWHRTAKFCLFLSACLICAICKACDCTKLFKVITAIISGYRSRRFTCTEIKVNTLQSLSNLSTKIPMDLRVCSLFLFLILVFRFQPSGNFFSAMCLFFSA